ncbi:MAG: hypothetical protein A4E40_00529 [Methanoregulaceae archaeon PtaU1.Bin059]|nr:MAG: hypothetical protein A4E40_00529 [Methanoregulaceae archaeon PtaU1.Bin059]
MTMGIITICRGVYLFTSYPMSPIAQYFGYSGVKSFGTPKMNALFRHRQKPPFWP